VLCAHDIHNTDDFNQKKKEWDKIKKANKNNSTDSLLAMEEKIEGGIQKFYIE
jgi:hypothetical protein